MKSSNGYEGTMPVVLFQEDGIWYAHCAALEITGYGHTSEEAKQSFEIMVNEFFRYASEEGTLRTELARLGWHVASHTPPPFGTLIERDETLRNLFDTKPVRTILEPIPAYS